jgi:hypothetical protein
MDYEIDYEKKLKWWQKTILIAIALIPAVAYVLFRHFLY